MAATTAVPASPDTAGAVIADYEGWQNASRKALPGDGNAFALPDVSPQAIQHEADALRTFRRRLQDLPKQGASAEDRLNGDLLASVIDERLGAIRFDEARLPFNSDGGFDSDLLYMVDRIRLTNADEMAGYLRLLAAVPGYYRDNLANARRGIATGFVMPRVTVERVMERARIEAAVPIDRDPLLEPLRKAASTIPQAQREAAFAQARGIVQNEIQPVREAFIGFLSAEYLPKARKALAVITLPGGQAYYDWLVRRYTTTLLAPGRIHEIGEAEVARIRIAMTGAMAEAGFAGTLPQFLAFLRSDPRFYAHSRQEMLEKGSEIAKRIDGQLPAHFATLPRLTYGVRAVPESIEDGYTTGRYFAGDPARGIAGGLMLNTSHLDQRPLYELPALVLHEGVPGHHLQGALAQERTDLPAFRRELYYSGFGEGWGLYSEWLGEEMGIYRDPYERFGRLSYDMWRACRLVADTGIHQLGWTMEQAKACFRENTALSELNIDVEVQRYVSWPGQALAYKLGELSIRRMRADAERTLGTAFDERRFHDAVLSGGALPLDLLEQQIKSWTRAEMERAKAVPATTG